MKTNLQIKMVSTLIAVATLALTSWAGEAVIKPLRYTSPAAVSISAPTADAAKVAPCPMCKNELVSTTTSDAKLTTKRILVSAHGCASCSTAIKTVGAQKATGKEVAVHSCAGRIATVASCCNKMAEKN